MCNGYSCCDVAVLNAGRYLWITPSLSPDYRWSVVAVMGVRIVAPLIATMLYGIPFVFEESISNG